MAGRILLVEDDRDLGDTLQMYLELHGFWVKVVPDAESALRTVAEMGIDLMITDEQLPGISGLTLATVLSEQGYSLPIVAFTGSHEIERLELSGRFAGVLRKPCEPECLVLLVRQVIGRRS